MKKTFVNRGMSIGSWVFVVFASASVTLFASAADFGSATLVRMKQQSDLAPTLSAFHFSGPNLKVFEDPAGAHVIVEGRFTPLDGDLKSWNLSLNQKEIRQKSGIDFQSVVLLTGKSTPVIFTGTDASGKKIQEDFAVLFTPPEASNPLLVTAGVGLSSLHYSESTTGQSMSQSSLKANLALERRLGKSFWTLGASAHSTLTVFSSPNPVQFFDLTLRAGYLLPQLKEPWSLQLYLGLHYTTTFGGSGQFGYFNLIAPEFSPEISYRFKNDALVSVNLKYASISSGQFGAGVCYFFSPLKSGILKGSEVGVEAEFSSLKLKSDTIGPLTYGQKTFGLTLRH